MATGLVDIMKRAALDAVDNSKMADIRIGTVTSVSPLKVQITTQFVLPDSLLIVPQHLTNYEVSAQIDDGDDVKLKIKNALKVGDRIALLRKQGGQFYYILDRI